MTTLIYSLEEAAKTLGMSETVLVRLSQYFRIPQAAYEEGNYLSFKGDLGFTGHDIAFFSQVQERILAGDSLETIRQRVHYDHIMPQPKAPGLPRATTILPETAEGDPLKRLAEKSFRRYKETNRPASGGIFKKIMHRVEEPESVKADTPKEPRLARGVGKTLAALFPQTLPAPQTLPRPASSREAPPLQVRSLSKSVSERKPLASESSRENKEEREEEGLNPTLRKAALRLRERALQQSESRQVFRR